MAGVVGPARVMLIVFAGLPGSGKTAVARAVADALGVTFLRVDSIESAIVSTLMPFEDNPVGYVVAERVAEDQLRAGRGVVVDAVNNVEIARDGWRALARRVGVPVNFVEVVCSDPDEHRRRVEGRIAEMPGHAVPTWEQVCSRGWEPWSGPRLRVDNRGPAHEAIATVLAALSG